MFYSQIYFLFTMTQTIENESVLTFTHPYLIKKEKGGIGKLFGGSSMAYQPTGSEIKKQRVCFNMEDITPLANMLAECQFPESPNFKANPAADSARMEVLYSKDNQFAAVQLFQYIPFEYQIFSPIHIYTNQEAVAFLNFMNAIK